MNESQISVRYAKALFQSAREKNQLDQVYEDMDLLAQTCALDDFQYVLLMPAMKPGRKCEVVGKVLEKEVSALSMSLINLVIQNKRGAYLPAIARNFRDLYRKAKGIQSATLVTALPVDEGAMKRIQDLIKKAYETDVELIAAVSKDIIGGFVLTIEDMQYDASVATNLRKLRKQLLQTRIEK